MSTCNTKFSSLIDKDVVLLEVKLAQKKKVAAERKEQRTREAEERKWLAEEQRC